MGPSLLVGTGVPPLPVRVQNLENKGFIFSLCARSLSFKELHAKSREHGSYGCCAVPFWKSSVGMGSCV
jgi:hypothetical protein